MSQNFEDRLISCSAFWTLLPATKPKQIYGT